MKFRFLLMVLVVLSASVANSQDFKKVVDIVVDMEASLKTMISSESTQRKTEIASLKNEVHELRASLTESPVAGTPVASTTSANVELSHRLESLEQQVASLHSSQETNQLAEQLSSLVTELKKSIDESKAVQANTDKTVAAFKQVAQVSGQVFASYSYTTDGAEGKFYNRFDLDRFYLTAKAQLFEDAKVQLTTDVFRNSASGSYYPGLSIRIKFGYLDYSPISSLSLKVGVIPTVWIGFIDSYWKYRGIALNITDRNSIFSSADIGLSTSYTLPGKFGEVSGFMLNGSGYSAPESNRFKDFGGRVNITPFPDDATMKSLVVAGYVYKGSNASKVGSALKRDRVGGFVGYGYAFASIGSEYSVRVDAPTNADTVIHGNAFSIFGEIKAPVEDLKNKLSLVWRHDMYEPNTEKGRDIQRFDVLGIAYKPYERITFALDRQWIRAEGQAFTRPDGSKTSYDSRWFLHTIVNF